MTPTVRGVLGVILGVLVALAITFVVELANNRAFPPPPGTDLANPESVKAMMAALPIVAFVVVLAGWFVGAVAGAWTAARFARPAGWPPLTVGVMLLAAAVMNMYTIPHPAWFWVVGIAVYPVATWIGAKLGGIPVVK